MIDSSLFERAILSVLLAGISVATCHADSQPNILWINAEDMSPHLGCYGHPDAVTPNIDRLAKQGVVYRNAFATAPICSPARSCLATGLYATSLGTQHLRCKVAIPDQVVPLAVRLRKAGYYCTNSGKTDYNFDPTGIWDATGTDAPWRNRKAAQPFFAFITIGETHEGRINFRERYEQATSGLPQDERHDPAEVTVPPFFPDTDEMRRILAGMHDLATVFDRKVGDVIQSLKDDNELENTVVFVFADHGNGLPRYKRWLNDSGLRVPLVVYLPPKYQALSPHTAGSQTNRLVSFVDFPATAMCLAGEEVPHPMQGIPFLGEKRAEPRQYVFGARSRADDMFEVSRSVFDGRFLYVRHFMPHLPYIQRSIIFDDRKAAFRELRQRFHAGQLNEHAQRMWSANKPVEELYDLKMDPHELNNLASVNVHAAKKRQLEQVLRNWILQHRDSGFLPESEYQIRATRAGVTPFDIVQDNDQFDLQATLDVAWNVGNQDVPIEKLTEASRHAEAGVRYWAAVAMLARDKLDDSARDALHALLADDSPSVRIAAAESILHEDGAPDDAKQPSLELLGKMVSDDRPWLALQAASALAQLGDRAHSLVPIMKAVIEKNRSEPGSRRFYRDFQYASFTGWALESALHACDESEYIRRIYGVPAD